MTDSVTHGFLPAARGQRLDICGREPRWPTRTGAAPLPRRHLAAAAFASQQMLTDWDDPRTIVMITIILHLCAGAIARIPGERALAADRLPVKAGGRGRHSGGQGAPWCDGYQQVLPDDGA